MAKRTRTLIFFVIMVVMAGLAVGCSNSTPAAVNQPNLAQPTVEQPAAVNPQSASPETMRLTVYHATKDAMYLVGETHVVPKNDHPAQTALELLLREPQNAELVQILPPGTKVRGVTIKDHVAFVDFNDKLIKNNVGGSATETLTVGAIVNTLTEFPDIHKVQILVGGQKIETISGHMDVSHPQSRNNQLIKK